MNKRLLKFLVIHNEEKKLKTVSFQYKRYGGRVLFQLKLASGVTGLIGITTVGATFSYSEVWKYLSENFPTYGRGLLSFQLHQGSAIE